MNEIFDAEILCGCGYLYVGTVTVPADASIRESIVEECPDCHNYHGVRWAVFTELDNYI